jgi:hypothetical protein
VRRRPLIAAVCACAPLILAGASATASVPGARVQVTVSVAVPVRSLTIAIVPPSGSPGCTPQQASGAVVLLLNRGENCQLPVGTIRITNGGVAAHIDVTGSDAVPGDRGKHWTLCGGSGLPCTGKRNRPGKDQFQVTTAGGTKKPIPATTLTYNAQCDTAYDLAAGLLACSATPGQAGNEGLSALVASSSTDSSLTFTSLITWTAVG